VGARLIATRPEDGETAAPGAAVVAVLAIEGDWSPDAVRMWLDGADVSGRFAIRTDRAWPPRRAEVVLPEVGPGEHEAELSWGEDSRATWRFAVEPGR
jgi:hypothetical protein